MVYASTGYFASADGIVGFVFPKKPGDVLGTSAPPGTAPVSIWESWDGCTVGINCNFQQLINNNNYYSPDLVPTTNWKSPITSVGNVTKANSAFFIFDYVHEADGSIKYIDKDGKDCREYSIGDCRPYIGSPGRDYFYDIDMKPKSWRAGVGGLGGAALLFDYVHFVSHPGANGDLGYHLYTTVPFKAHEEIRFGYQFQGIVGAIYDKGLSLPSPPSPPGKALNFEVKKNLIAPRHLIPASPVTNVKLKAPSGTVPLYRYHVCFNDGEGKTKFASFLYTALQPSQHYYHFAASGLFKSLTMSPLRPNLNRPLWIEDTEALRLVIEDPFNNDAVCSDEAHTP